MPTRISDIVLPEEFTPYVLQNSLLSLAVLESGVAVTNGVMQAQLGAGAQQFTVPVWNDLQHIEANLSTDDPLVNSTPNKVTAFPQVVRKWALNQSWSEINLASELAGSDALTRIQSRVVAYWQRQMEKRLIATMLGAFRIVWRRALAVNHSAVSK